MREPSLQKTTALSLALHISVLLTALLLLRQSNQFIMPSPYVVSLVSPEALKAKGTESRESLETLKTSSKTFRDTSVIEGIPKQDIKKGNKKEEEIAEERIAAIAAKKKVERLVRLRSVISLKASGNDSKDSSETTPAQAGEGSLFDEYYTKIRKEIWQQWVFSDIGQKDLEAIISIRIMKDGTIFIQSIEKSSGNPFFDRSAIKAITKANPLSPPPYEMEIGVKFYP
jgi:colicin import membrane protein